MVKPIIRCAIAVLCMVFASLAGAQQPANATPPLRGHVRSAGGQPLSDVVTREELAPLGDIPLGEAITRAPSAVNLLRDMQVSRNVACVLLNGYQMIGQASLDNYDSDDVEFLELYPPYMRPPSSVMAYMGIAGCSSTRSALMDSGGILYAVVWMKN